MKPWLQRVASTVTSMGGTCGSGCSPQALTELEDALDITIVGSFRDFLLQLGWLDAPGFEVAGFGDREVGLNLASYALSEWAPDMHGPRRPLLPLRPLGNGDSYCLDLRHGVDEPPIVIWGHEYLENDPDQIVPEAASFSAWLGDDLAAQATEIGLDRR